MSTYFSSYNNLDVTGATGTVTTLDTSTNWIISSPAQTEISFKPSTINNTKRIGARLYFKYVKSKLTPIQTEILKKRLVVLKKVIQDAEDLGQHALSETAKKMIYIAVRESEMVACGITTKILLKNITKHMDIITESEKENNKIVYFKNLEEFPREIPKNIATKIKGLKKRGLFSEFKILYLDYTNDSKEIKSNKEKIREKDPIVFGIDSLNPDILYYIADWVDEVCDLTLEKIIDTYKIDSKDIPNISTSYLEEIKESLKKQQKRLKAAKPSTYKNLMKDEDSDKRIDKLGKLLNRAKSFIKKRG